MQAPEPEFESGSEAPQASRISKLPHSGIEFCGWIMDTAVNRSFYFNIMQTEDAKSENSS